MAGPSVMSETRKSAPIFAALVGYSRLAGADEDRILARLRVPRSDVIAPRIAVLQGVRRSAPAMEISSSSEALSGRAPRHRGAERSERWRRWPSARTSPRVPLSAAQPAGRQAEADAEIAVGLALGEELGILRPVVELAPTQQSP
jgi:hypothetical protein